MKVGDVTTVVDSNGVERRLEALAITDASGVIDPPVVVPGGSWLMFGIDDFVDNDMRPVRGQCAITRISYDFVGDPPQGARVVLYRDLTGDSAVERGFIEIYGDSAVERGVVEVRDAGRLVAKVVNVEEHDDSKEVVIRREGAKLEAEPGSWTGEASIRYQWELCDSRGKACRPIAGACTSSYAIRPDDEGAVLRVVITLSTADGETSIASEPERV